MEGWVFEALMTLILLFWLNKDDKFLSNPDSFLSYCLRTRYFPIRGFLKAKASNSPSYTWRSIHHTRRVIKKGGFWTVGMGHYIDIWEDKWLPLQHGYKVWSPKFKRCDTSLVYELISHEFNCWNSQLVNSLFLPFEATHSLQIPFPSSTQHDCFSW